MKTHSCWTAGTFEACHHSKRECQDTERRTRVDSLTAWLGGIFDATLRMIEAWIHKGTRHEALLNDAIVGLKAMKFSVGLISGYPAVRTHFICVRYLLDRSVLLWKESLVHVTPCVRTITPCHIVRCFDFFEMTSCHTVCADHHTVPCFACKPCYHIFD